MIDPKTAPPAALAGAMATGRFPRAALDARLRDARIDAAGSDAALERIGRPRAPADIARKGLPMGSVVAVGILGAIEPITGFELPDRVARAGGHAAVDGFVADPVPRIGATWPQRQGDRS